jgi:precorrin-6A/cobalt-precorrin-6A reductase
MIRLLILGGTTEAGDLARAVAERLPDIEAISSLAGVAGVPALPGRIRVGGFGGVEGLADYLKGEDIGAVIDATHPFAARISAHAVAACAATGVPLLRLERGVWQPQTGDRWLAAAHMPAAAALLPGLGRRAFLTVGAKEVGAFAAVAGVWFLVRLLAEAPPPFPGSLVVAGRGPFTVAAERDLMRRHGIDILVTKASGGAATAAKLRAARELGLPVVMVRRPASADGAVVDSVAAAVEWVSGPQQVSMFRRIEP